MIKYRRVFLIVILSVLFVFYFYLIYHFDNKLSNINCNSNVIFIDNQHGLSLNSQYTLSMGEKNGWLKIKGKLTQGDNEYLINRKLYFENQRNMNMFVLEVNEISTGIDDDFPKQLLSHFLPLAYTQEGLKMDIFIYPQTNNGYLITSSDHYGVYCGG